MRKFFTLMLALGSAGSLLQAQTAFSPNSIVVVRAGSTDSANSNRSREVFLHEYDTASGNLIQTISIPYSGTDKLTISGTASTEGFLKRSVNKAYLTLGGYDLGLGVSSPSSSGTNANRVIARVGFNGVVEIGTKVAHADMFPNGAFRAVASVDGSGYWAAGGTNGTRYVAHGATSTKNLSATVTNQRSIGIYDNQLFLCHSSGTAVSRIYQIGTQLSSTDSAGATTLPGIPTTAGVTAADFFFADLSESVAGPDVLYVADETSGSGLIKYSLVGGSWVENSRVTTPTLRGLAGERTAAGVAIFGTRNNGTELVKLYDNGGYNAAISGSFTALATAATNTAFRGMAFAPVDATLSLTLLTFSASTTSRGQVLNWTSSNEMTAHSYEVERSDDGAQFRRIMTVPAKGSAGLNSYEREDLAKAVGKVYYRIRMIDKEGKSKYSRTLALAPARSGRFRLYPNPLADGHTLTITHGETRGAGNITIFTNDGRQVTSIPVPVRATQTSLNLQHLPAGTYRVVMDADGQRQSAQLLKQ